MKRISKILLLLAIFNLIACTTQKSRSDVSGVSKFYHNVTAEYNGYFNANVLLTESIAKLNEQHQDNYNKILPVYQYVANENPKAVAGDINAAIEKVSIVISIHRVSDWTDDCYFLIGQAQYLKKDYESAEETFEFLEAEFNPKTLANKKKKSSSAKKKSSNKKKKKEASKKKKKRSKAAKENKKKRKKANKKAKKNRKKKSSGKKKKSSSSKKDDEKTSKDSGGDKIKVERSRKKKKKKSSKEEEEKKEDEKPDDKPLKKHPAYQIGQLWLALTYIERDNYEKADNILDKLEQDSKTFKEVKRDMAPARAHFYLKQKQYSQAIAPLEQAIELAKDKENKARYSFILAQIYQQEKNTIKAVENFELAEKYARDYEMQFSAKLELEKSAWLASGGSLADAVKRLEKMLKDIKNSEYRDLIYFTLASIALEKNNEVEGINYLKKSLASSVGNEGLKAESYILLANLYYDNHEFISAKNYFDSTLMVLAETDERYDRVNRFATNLTDIANNLLIIEEQDSLLAISGMSEKEKLELAYRIKKEKDKQKLEDLKRKSNKISKNTGKNQITQYRAGGITPSSFFAYNEKSLKKGKKEFTKLWGSRKLEDNWRRSNKRGLGDFDEVAEIQEDAARELTDDDVSKILKDIPDTPEEIQAAKDKIIDAMFALGALYRDRLQMNEESIEMLERLNQRFPGNTHELDSWYFLYLAHSDMNNISKAKEYYDKIVSKYPDSTYAGVLLDPNFLEHSKEEERRLTRYYNETYAQFTSGKYENASQRVEKAVEMFGPSNLLQPKFSLLYAMCMGNLKGKDAYKKELQQLIAKYPGTPEQIQAKEILRILGGRKVTADDKDKIGGETLKKEDEAMFKIEDKKLHYFIVALKNNTIKLSDAKAAVSDYNRQYHKLDKLRISNVYLGTDTSTPILVIRRFKTKTLAMGYFDGVSKNGEDFLPEDTEYEMFAVTQYNYRQILKTRSLVNYRTFFEENYK